MQKILKYFIPICICFLLILSGCVNQGNEEVDHVDKGDESSKHEDDIKTPEDQNKDSNEEGSQEDNGEDNENIEGETEGESQREDVFLSTDELKEIKANELGKIMILMYHGIGEEEDVWVRTPDNFRKDLKTLYDKDYRAISMKDFIKGDINTAPGTTPVILTFDDGLQGQFNILREDEFLVDPDSAVGILEDFNSQYPDFGLKATFYVFYPIPFRQEKWINKKFEYLVEKGMEIGNHAYSHENLRIDMSTNGPRDAKFVQEALGKNVKMTKEILPNYEVDSLALPYGAAPGDDAIRKYVVDGAFDGIEYHNGAVLLVGSNPARSFYHKENDMARLPRVRASELETEGLGLYDWLDYFERHPEERYISDGNSKTISFPKALEEDLSNERVGDRTIQAYE